MQLPPSPYGLIFKGLYPRIHSNGADPHTLYSSYIRTYVERDVRTIKNIGDLGIFTQFLKLCAGRIGQLLDLTSLATDCGVSLNTIKSWLSILESSYIIFRLQPSHKNFRKRLVKRSKIHFNDTGLACNLLGIESKDQLLTHYLCGGLFESFVINELSKEFWNQGKQPALTFWRDSRGNEIGCIMQRGIDLVPIEIKSSSHTAPRYFDGLKYWHALSEHEGVKEYIIYGGTERWEWDAGTIISWNDIASVIE